MNKNFVCINKRELKIKHYIHSSVNLKVHKTDMSHKSQALTLLVLLAGVALAKKPFLECPSKNRDVMVIDSHLSKGLMTSNKMGCRKKDYFQTQFCMPFTG